MEKLKVLLVDDDLTFGCIAVKVLESAGFAVHYQNSLFGIESLIVKLNPNIIILDVMIGDDNSLERINNIRLASEDIPIIIVSSHDELEFEEQAVSNGAVVYLEKPFTSEKLVMWVRRYARTADAKRLHLIDIGIYTVDLHSRILRYQGKEDRQLTNTEFATLKYFLLHKNEIVTRQDLKTEVWSGVVCTEQNLNNVMYHLRKYLERDASIHVDTIRGEGFKLWED